jgi:hypothetical protein
MPRAPRWGSKNCKGKPLLEYDIRKGRDRYLNGTLKSALEMHTMRPEYELHKIANFSANLKSLREKISGLKVAAELEDAAVARQLRKFPTNNWVTVGVGDAQVVYPRWQGHPAQYLLRLDIKGGNTEGHSPMSLRASRPLYRLFPLQVFRDHIYKELKALKQDRWNRINDVYGDAAVRGEWVN